jgi:FlaA1/EpsC-like NDP-sugar epimerase
MIDSREDRESKASKSDIRNFYEGRNIFITGVTGFIGKVRRLLSQQHPFFLYSRKEVKFKELCQ